MFDAYFLYLSLCFHPQTSSLQYLEARNTPLLDHSAPFVARALRISGSLAVLHLENAGLSGRPLMLLGTTDKSWEPLFVLHIKAFYLFSSEIMMPSSHPFVSLVGYSPFSHGPKDEHEPAGVVPG